MNEKIKEHVKKWCEREGYDTSDEGIIVAITEANVIWSGERDAHRWWIEKLMVCAIDGMLIGYVGAETTGDDSPYDKGWELDPATICLVEPVEITTTIYRRKVS